MDFAAAARDLGPVLSFRLDAMEQATVNPHNWRGPADSSLRCDLGFSPVAVVMSGVFRDDTPFYQTMTSPARPDWWRIAYGADGIDVLIDDPTSAARRIRFALDAGSAATDPRVDLVSTFAGAKPGPVPSAILEFRDSAGPGSTPGAVAFDAAIPLEALAPPEFFTRPLRITVRLHDMDGGPSTYIMMQQTVERRGGAGTGL